MMNLLTIESVAGVLKLSKESIYKLIRSQKLKAFKVGVHQWRVDEDDLKTFIREGVNR